METNESITHQVLMDHLTAFSNNEIELFVGPTLEVFVTVEPTALFKRLNPEFNAGVIDPSLEK